MTTTSIPKKKIEPSTFDIFIAPLLRLLPLAPLLLSKGDRPLKMNFEEQLKALIYFHLQEHDSARHFIQDMEENDFARENIAPEGGISRSSFSEIINGRGLEQLQFMFENLYKQAAKALPKQFQELGELISIDGSLISAVLSMYWADYRKGSKKAKAHCGFDINRGILSKIFLTDGNGGERPFVSQILSKGQTGVMDRGYQSHHDFDQLQEEEKHFACRIKDITTKTVLQENAVEAGSHIFYDAVVLLGTPGQNQTVRPVRVVGYQVAGVKYYVATDRHDLTAEQIATVYKLRWTIGVSSKGHINQSVKVRPRIKDSSLVAGEALWRETKMVKPSDNILKMKNEQTSRPQRAVNADVASLHEIRWLRRSITCESNKDVLKKSLIQAYSLAGYQRWHGRKVYVETGEALGIRRRKTVEEANPITLNGKWMSRYQGGGLDRSTADRCAAKRTRREGSRLMNIPTITCEAGVR